jgi:iron complex outermembrane recepter protein
MSNGLLRKSVRTVLAGGLASTIAVPAAIAGQDDEGLRELERVQVTGSRITRTQLEGATPVMTISREDIDSRGFQSVADVLRNMSFNVHGSFVQDSGTTAQSQATMNMRGIGSNKTLVLMNGRRMPGSPVLDGQIQNLNVLPFAAVERIEILSDGASAVYGSDAIGGVINIILRDDFEGVELNAYANISDREGGDERGASIVGGVAGPRGNVTYAIEHNKTDIIFSRHRHFNQSFDPGTGNFTDVIGMNEFGRNIIRFDTGQWVPMVDQNCQAFGDFHHGPFEWAAQPGDSNVCAYDHTQTSATTADLDRLNLFMDASYEINADHAFFSRMLHSRVESFGRYAPAAGLFAYAGPDLPAEALNDEFGNTMPELRTGDLVAYRFDNTGPSRDDIFHDFMTDITFGFQGVFGAMDYEVAYTHNIYEMHEWSTGYVNDLGLALSAAGGWDPRHPDQDLFADFVADMSENANRRARLKSDRIDFGGQFDGPMLNSGPVTFFVGGDYREERYVDEVQAQAAAGNILGTSGGISGGSREAWAVFTEVNIPVTPTFDFDFAIRHDDYSDFGTNLSGKVSARWQPSPSYIVRGSVGTGFRAPSLDMLFQNPAQSFNFAQDITACMGGTISEVENDPNFGDNLGACLASPALQHETLIDSNPDLDAETSFQYNLGMVLDFNQWIGQDLTMSIDYYYIEIDDVITPISTQDLFWVNFMERMGDAAGLEYNPQAGVPHVVRPTNFEKFDTSGVDLNVRYSTGLGNFGSLALDFNLSYILEFNDRFILLSEQQDYSDLTLPGYRADASATWSHGPHSVNWFVYYIPGHCIADTLDSASLDDASLTAVCQTIDGRDRELGGWSHHNVQYSFDTPFDSTITVGINNVTDKDPQLDMFSAFDNQLYPHVGRQYLVRYTQRF